MMPATTPAEDERALAAPTADLLSLRGFLVSLLRWASVQAAGHNANRIALETGARTADQRFWEALTGKLIPTGIFENPELGDAMDRLTANALLRVVQSPYLATQMADHLARALVAPEESRAAMVMLAFIPGMPIHMPGPTHAIGAVNKRMQDAEDAAAAADAASVTSGTAGGEIGDVIVCAPEYDGPLSAKAVNAIGFELTSCPAPIFPPGLGRLLNPYGRPVTPAYVFEKVTGMRATHAGIEKQLESIFRAAGWVPAGEPGHWDVAPPDDGTRRAEAVVENDPRLANALLQENPIEACADVDPTPDAPVVTAADDSLEVVGQRLEEVVVGSLVFLTVATSARAIVLGEGSRTACAFGARAIRRFGPTCALSNQLGSLVDFLDSLADGQGPGARQGGVWLFRERPLLQLTSDGPAAVLADTWKGIPWQSASVLPDGQVALVMPRQGGGGGNASFLLIGYERTRPALGEPLPAIHLRVSSGPWKLQTPSLADADEIEVRPGTLVRFLPPAILGADATVSATLASPIVLPNGPAPAPLHRWGFRLLGVIVPAHAVQDVVRAVTDCMSARQEVGLAIAMATKSYRALGGV